MNAETKMQILDTTVTVALFVIACIIGKLAMDNVANTWLGFNGPAMGIIFVGELFWFEIRKKLNH